MPAPHWPILDQVDPEAAAVARKRYGCLAPWAETPEASGRMALRHGHAFCEDGGVKVLRELLGKRPIPDARPVAPGAMMFR